MYGLAIIPFLSVTVCVLVNSVERNAKSERVLNEHLSQGKQVTLGMSRKGIIQYLAKGRNF